MNAKKKALGKGLGALLEDSQNYKAPEYQVKDDNILEGVANIPLTKIDSNPFQPRKEFAEDLLQELAASIKEQGIIQPVTLRKKEDDTFQIISGERRVRAAKLAGLEDIPAYIRTASDQEMLEMALVENIQREDLNPVEIADSYNQLIEECGLTQEALSERVSKKRSTITNYLRLLRLPGEIQKGLIENKISMGHAKALINVDDPNTQINIFNDTIAENYSVREVEEIVRNLDKIDSRQKKETKKKTLPGEYIELQERLSNTFGSKIKVKSGNKGKGSIEIPFNSQEELNEILKIIES